MADIEITGIRELQAKLDKLDDVGAAIGDALMLGGAELMTWVKEYPPSTIANQAHGLTPDRWYERGMGSHYITTKGEHRIYKTSQMLSRSWSEEHSFTPQQATVRIGTRATYARYVHDEKKQVYFHMLRGWRTAQDAVRKFERGIVKRVEDAITRAIGA